MRRREGSEPGMSKNALREMRQDQYIARVSEVSTRISDLGNAGRHARKACQVSLHLGALYARLRNLAVT